MKIIIHSEVMVFSILKNSSLQLDGKSLKVFKIYFQFPRKNMTKCVFHERNNFYNFF